MPRRRLLLTAALAAPLAVLGLSQARAADDILIGAVYPLTGNAAQVGLDAKAAFATEADIINGTHAPIPMLLGQGGGLPHLGGAHVRIIMADSQNDPEKARSEAERLITQEHVVAILGSYTSATAATISQVTDRYEVPYISCDNSSPSLTRRGLKWFFRPSPTDDMFSKAMFEFFADIGKQTGRPVHSISLFYEDSIFGSDSSKAQRGLAKAAGIAVKADVKYRANSPTLSSEAEELRAADADVMMPSSYTSDAILILRAMHDIGYTPKAIMAQAAGFQEQAFLTGAGALAEGAMSRSSYAGDAVKARPAIPAVNAMFHARQGKDLNDNTSRQVTGLMVLADAIDRAGSTKNDALQKALQATNIPGAQTIMPWTGIKFDPSGQNIEGTPVIQQVKDGSYHTIWPADVATVPTVWNVGK